MMPMFSTRSVIKPQETFYQLTKRQILESYYEQTEAEIYLVMSRLAVGTNTFPIWYDHRFASVSFTWTQTGQRRRKTLTMVAPTLPLPEAAFWKGDERHLCPNGNIIKANHCLAFYAPDGQGEALSTFLQRAALLGYDTSSRGNTFSLTCNQKG